jgi:hypothetical protein
MQQLLDFIAFVLAVEAMMNAWFYGSLLKEVQTKVADRFELFGCSFCLAYHVPWILAFALWLPAQWCLDPWNNIPRALLYSLAATTLVHFMQRDHPLVADDDAEPDDPNATPVSDKT